MIEENQARCGRKYYMLTERNCNRYIKVLEEELICAMGCTEPIAIAYAAATAR